MFNIFGTYSNTKKMGAWVSDNYDQVTFVFQLKYWKVHSAIKKSTRENVFLWLMDEELLNKIAPKNQQAVDQYIKNCLAGLQLQRKLHHPHILKIHEINETSRPLSFCSEPVEDYLKLDERYAKDECLYIAKQLAETMDFLHEKAKIAHLCLAPESICITDDFSIKLTNFAYACQIAEGENSFLVPKSNYQAFQVPTQFMSLEQFMGKQMTQSSDVYSFSALISSIIITRNLYDKPSSNASRLLPRSLEEDTRNALEACLEDNPSDRPSFAEIKKCTGICVMSTQILNYVDQSFAKTPQDKFAFFKGLFKVLPSLSTRLLTKKMLPFMSTELKNDIRFGPAIIPLIISIGERYDSNKFMVSIFPLVENYLTVTNPPELSLSVFASLEILIDKIPQERHFDLLYPIFTSALDTSNSKLHQEAIKKMPMMVEVLPTNVVDNSVVPRLTTFISECDSASSLCPIIKCLIACADKVNQSSLAKSAMTRISDAFIKSPTSETADQIATLLATLRIPSDIFMRYCVPLCAVVSSFDTVNPNTVKNLCRLMHGCIKQICEEKCGFAGQQQYQKNLQAQEARNKLKRVLPQEEGQNIFQQLQQPVSKPTIEHQPLNVDQKAESNTNDNNKQPGNDNEYDYYSDRENEEDEEEEQEDEEQKVVNKKQIVILPKPKQINTAQLIIKPKEQPQQEIPIKKQESAERIQQQPQQQQQQAIHIHQREKPKPKPRIERRMQIRQQDDEEVMDDILFGERKSPARPKLKTKY